MKKLTAKKRVGRNSKGKNHWRFKDITGNVYGMLSVVSYKESIPGRGPMWLCKCECGGSVIADGCHIRNGHTKSCGCLSRRKGANHPMWKGGILYSNGYKYIYCPDHDNVTRKTSGMYVGEHTYVMSKHLGRALSDDEVVHHKNGNKTDNRLDNLELCLRKKHQPGQSIEETVKYAIDILTKYAPETLCKECHKKEGI